MAQIKFGGKILREPQAASKFIVGIPPKANPLATGRVCVLGESEGGEVNKVLWFTDKAGAEDVLRSGDGLRAIGYIFNPSPQEDGAPHVAFVRTQAATQGDSGTTFGSIKFTSRDWGTWVNNIQVKVEAGTEADTKKVSINYSDIYEIQDNLGLAVTLQYTGSSTAAKIEVTADDHIKGTHGDTGTENTSFDFDFSLSQYDTLAKLVRAIDDVTDWTCTIYEYAPAGVGTLVSTVLNTLTAADAKTTEVYLQAYPHIMKHWADENSAYVTASVETDGTAPTVAEYTALTGGTAPEKTTADVTAALTLIEEENIQVIWINSETAADYALVDAHCRNDAQNERIAFFGGASQSTKSAAITDVLDNAKTLNSARSVLVACGIDEFKEDGSGVEALSPKFFAAKMAGLAAGLSVQEPLTHKVFSCQGLQYDFSKSERKQLINGGVLAPRFYEGVGYIVNQGVNTLQNNMSLWDASTNSSPEISLMRSSDQIVKELRVAADKTFIGGTVGIGRNAITGFVESFLKDKEREGIIAGNDSDPDNPLPAWENVVAARLDDGWHAKFSVRFNNPFNFFLIEAVAVL